MEITNYKITKEIGRGGMAIVYLAHDNKFDTNVAVKVLNKELVNNENIRKRFIAEARKMFKMSHPNIIKVTDLIEEGDTVAFVMEYVEGDTLKDYIDRKGKLSDEEIKSLFSQMLDAVGYVHEQNLVHRDIKPSNFMLDKKGRIKLMDFGIAKTTDTFSAEYTQTGTGVQMGTPMYMSPEQITETKSVTAQSDIYSLGVVLWQMVTGQKPYNTNTLSSFQLQTKIVNEPLDNTNSHWDDLIQKATTKDIASRYISVNAFKITLDSKNDKKVIESDSTIIDNVIKQASEPDPSSKLEEKVNNEKVQVKEEVQLKASKKNYLPVIIIAALCITALVVYLVYNPGSSYNYEEENSTLVIDSLFVDSTAVDNKNKTEKNINFIPLEFQEKAVEKLLKNKKGIFKFATGSGKTKAAILFMLLIEKKENGTNSK
jgi:serine/threonine-protein kinase